MADTLPRPAPPPVDLDDASLYVNRELSLLKFQERVLEEACDPSNPLLERVKFLAIVGSNLDEFFMVRVAGLKQQVMAGVTETGPDGRTPADALTEVRRACQRIMQRAREALSTSIGPALAEAGIGEYWIVNLLENIVEVYREPAGSTYASRQDLSRGQTLAIGALGGTAIDMNEVLPP